MVHSNMFIMAFKEGILLGQTREAFGEGKCWFGQMRHSGKDILHLRREDAFKEGYIPFREGRCIQGGIFLHLMREDAFKEGYFPFKEARCSQGGIFWLGQKQGILGGKHL